MRRIQKRILTYILPELAQSIVKRYGESAYLIGDLGAQAVLYMSLVDADFDENERRDGLSFVTRLYELHLLSE
ncbi:MAG: hypothetical protein NT020_08135, partial [Chloroflexales bacterium]|nr:hypothetical protein [Chloroflexales bacterium]